MHAVLRLVEDDGPGSFKDLIRHFHGLQAELLINRNAVLGLKIVIGRQAVHEAALFSRGLHQGLRHLVRQKIMNTLCPDLFRLSHGDPDIRVQDICVPDSLHRIGLKLQCGAGFCRDGFAFFNQRRIREVLLRRAGHKVQTHLDAADHEGIAHIIPGIPEVDQLLPLQGTEMLPDCEEVRQNLGRMELIGQAVPHRDTGIRGQLLHTGLLKAAVLNAVKHPSQNPGRIGNALLLPQL